MKPKTSALAEYINVDLEIRSRTDLRPLVEALSRRLSSLYVGRDRTGFLATFENGASVRGANQPDLAIRRMVRAIDSLTPAMKRHWTTAHDRVFDIGVAKTSGSKVFWLSLDKDTVKAAARLGARLALSFYPPYYP